MNTVTRKFYSVFYHTFESFAVFGYPFLENLKAICALTFLNLNYVSNYCWRVRYIEVQWNLLKVEISRQLSTTEWNLLKADILFSGQLSATDNFLQNRWNDVQTFITKSLCSGQPSIADIIFMPQITLHLRTPNNRPCKKYYTFLDNVLQIRLSFLRSLLFYF